MSFSLFRYISSVVLASLLFACSQGTDTPTTSGTRSDAGGTANYNLSMDIAEFMAHVVEPVADSLWQTAGWVLDRDDGYYELYDSTITQNRALYATVSEVFSSQTSSQINN